jgi:hypothetical protein
VTAPAPDPHYDAFFSYASPDRDFAVPLVAGVEGLGLNVYFDKKDIEPGRNYVGSLASDGLAQSRFLVLVLSQHTAGRDWVEWEYSTFMARHGPLDHIIPVLIDNVPLPDALLAAQAVNALDRDVARVAAELCQRIGKPEQLPPGDRRRLTLGQRLVYVLRRRDERWTVRGQDGKEREVESPHQQPGFAEALGAFRRLVRVPVASDGERGDLFHAATAVGRGLFEVLFDDAGRERLRQTLAPGDRPLLTLLGDDEVLALPWELLHDGERFLVRDDLDLVRSTPGEVAPATLLKEPARPFRLVVNVSAPAGSALDY